jgi:hypothetical protein
MLKQAYKNEEWVFEIECTNCRKINTVSEEFYLSIRLDNVMPSEQPINGKLPKDMNVIFVSMRRCGISWIIRELSKFHMKMFSSPIPFTPKNAEISSSIATLDGYPLPKQWNNVYDIYPQELLDRTDPDGNKYDRVIVIHRDLETLKGVNRITMAKEGLDPEYVEKLLDKLSEEHEIVYGNVIEDPRILYVDLWQSNNKPDAIFNELMDFLNFPTYNRPPVVGVKGLPFLQMIEAYSSVWDKDFKLTGMLGRVEGLFKLSYDGLLSYIAKALMNKKHNLELERVLIIGAKIHQGQHFSENIYYAFQEKGIDVQLLPIEDLCDDPIQMSIYKKRKALYMISKALEKTEMKPQLILFDEPAFSFFNDQHIPVFYFHREFKRPPTVYHPDIAFFWHEGVVNYFENIFAPYWCEKVPQILVMPIANKKGFDFSIKKIKGIVLLAGRERISDLLNVKEITAQGILKDTVESTKEALKYIEVISDENGGLTNARYNKLLPQCEAVWCHIPLGQYTSRRIIEAMLCKTVVVMKLQNQEHEDILEKMGLFRGVHYVGMDDLSELNQLNASFKYKDWSEMIEKAYDVVSKLHMYSNRADYIIDLYKDITVKKRIQVR